MLAHHAARPDETESYAAHGADTALEIAGLLRWTRRRRHLDELDIFNQMLAVGETGAHLTLLVTQGRLDLALDDGVRRYRPVAA